MIKKIIPFIILILMTNIVNAENGSISVRTETDFPYYTNTGTTFGGSTTNMSVLNFAVAQYTRIIRFRAVFNTIPSISPTTGETTFTIDTTTGNSGHGIVYFDASTKNITWIFSEDTYIVNSPIFLNYANTSVFAPFGIVSGSPIGASRKDVGEDINHPMYISTTNSIFPVYALTGIGNFDFYEALFVGTNTTVLYNVTYPVSGYYLTNITKLAGTKTSWIRTHSRTISQFSEGAYTLNNVNAMNETLDGIYINVTMQAGGTEDVLINDSMISNTYNILFNKTSYNLNEDIAFNTNITNFEILDNYYVLFSQEVIGDTVYTQNYPIISSNTVTYPQIDKTKISFVYAQLFKNGISVYTSSAIPYGMNQNISNIVGNITLDKNQYALSENVNIKYNMSVSGRIIVQCQDILYSENVYAGYGLQTNYTISNLELFPCQVKLQYYYTVINDWITLDYKIYETIEAIDNIFFSKSYASLGDTIDVYYNAMGDRILSLKDSNNNIKFSYYVTASAYGLSKQYTLISTDVTGNYTAFLNYTNDTTIMTDTIMIMDAIIISPTQTSNVTYSLFDLVSDGSKAIIGDIDLNHDGDISDYEIKKKGDKMYYIFIFLALVILISGTWNKLIRRK